MRRFGVLVALAQREHVGTTTLLASRYALGAIALWLALLLLRRPLPNLRVGAVAVALAGSSGVVTTTVGAAVSTRVGAVSGGRGPAPQLPATTNTTAATTP